MEKAVAGGLAGLLCWQGHLVEWRVGRRHSQEQQIARRARLPHLHFLLHLLLSTPPSYVCAPLTRSYLIRA